MSNSPSAAAWSLVGRRAACAVGGPPSAIDLDRPEAGIEIHRHRVRAADALLGLDLDACFRCVDAWCRGGDVTAVYETDDGERLRATAMWRAQPRWLAAARAADAWCREAVISAQTSLLESVPRIRVVADAAGGTVVPVAFRHGGLARTSETSDAPQGLLVSWGHDSALLFFVHPADARTVECVAKDDRVKVTAELFPAAVEKGVLLRGRVVAAFGPVSPSAVIPAWAENIAAAFTASAPVLTT